MVGLLRCQQQMVSAVLNFMWIVDQDAKRPLVSASCCCFVQYHNAVVTMVAICHKMTWTRLK